MNVALAPVFLYVAMGSLPAFAQAVGESGTVADSRFRRTAVYLQESTPELRADFADTALRELALVYMREAQLAREDLRFSENPRKLESWSRVVDAYASQVMQQVRDIERDFPVRLSPGEEFLVVSVNGRNLVLSHPRKDQQSTMEQNILANFCSRHACDRIIPAIEERTAIPVSAIQARPDWTFTGDGAVCSYLGITVHFSSPRELPRSRLTCEQFIQEALALADEVAWQRRQGVRIDWEALAIESTPGKPEHVVRLNAAGDAVLAVMPVINGSPGLLLQITPWVRSRVTGSRPVNLQLQAASFGWEGSGQ